MLDRAYLAASIAAVTSLWCWIMVAGHGIWSLGFVRGYLQGGEIPLFPGQSVTYGSFFVHSLGAVALPFMVLLIACFALPKKYHLPLILAAWLLGAWAGLDNLAFVYQLDYGTTWAPGEALRALVYHPIITPFWGALGLVGALSLTRPLRRDRTPG